MRQKLQWVGLIKTGLAEASRELEDTDTETTENEAHEEEEGKVLVNSCGQLQAAYEGEYRAWKLIKEAEKNNVLPKEARHGGTQL